MIRFSLVVSFVLSTLLAPGLAMAQTGKIAGTVTDAETGEPLPGVNVVVVGTERGATTGGAGNYAILNVSPGTYDVQASFVGYASMTQQGVNVNIDLTTEVDFEMQEQTSQLEEVTVQATEAVVKRDISANIANLSAEDIANVPVGSIEEVIGLQAGVEPGLNIRGGGRDQLSLRVDGISMRDGRRNEPFTGISYTSVEEVQVQTGGFNAEYGNVRSGLINVVTKEGPRDHYMADLILRYSAPSAGHFGPSPGDPEAYWMRPYVDPDVALVGTDSDESPWDRYVQDQYPRWEGWQSVSDNLRNDDDPTNDLSPQELQDIFDFRHRKSFEPAAPNYEVDASLGGPVPLLGQQLGGLRFFASYRQTQDDYVVSQMRDAYRDRTGQAKLTSDIASNVKLTVQGLHSVQSGINTYGSGEPIMANGEMPKYPWDNRGNLMIYSLGREALFGYNLWSKMDVTRSMTSVQVTHTLGSNTFYQAQIKGLWSDYFTRPGDARDPSTVEEIGGYELDEAPRGYTQNTTSDFSGLGLRAPSLARDSSSAGTYSAKFDLTSQLNQFLQLKTGMEYINNSIDMAYGSVDLVYIHHTNPWHEWTRNPRQGAAYVQNKLEFEGMVANMGLRLDYFNPAGEWYVYDTYDRALSPNFGADELDETLPKDNVRRQFSLSPRLGVSFPITESSKLYFNYGHFRQMLTPLEIFTIEEINTGAVSRIGNPDHPMPKTVAYELGYEQNLFNLFLVRLTGYYRDTSLQPRLVNFNSVDGLVDYNFSLPNNYQDTRGFELSVSKNVGKWVRGFANYSYMATKSGNFGFAEYYENQFEQRQFERESRAHYQSTPVPEPYASFNVAFFTPEEFGPQVVGFQPVGNWRLDLLGQWRAGQVFTWTGGQTLPELENNAQWSDYYNLDLRLAKNIETGFGTMKFFADVSNVLNIRHMNRYAGWEGFQDFEKYMQSLHLPAEYFDEVGRAPYAFIAGNDEPGVFREFDTPYIPIEIINSTQDVDAPMHRPLYYIRDEAGSGGTYFWYRDGTWAEAEQGYVESVLENKAYINMPNESYFTFLNPRRVTFGMRISL